MGEKWSLQRIAVLAIMMFFLAGTTAVYAEMPTTDQAKDSEHLESESNENEENEAEDDKKEDLKKSEEDRGYGPFGSTDLYMDVIDTVEGVANGNSIFGPNLEKMLEKYGAELAKEQQLKSKKKKEQYERKKEAAKKLREEEKKREKAENEVVSGREGKPGKAKWYNWYKKGKSNGNGGSGDDNE